MSVQQFVQLSLEVVLDCTLSPGAKVFLAHLMRWDWGNGCWLTDRQLARELGISVRSVRNHTKALEEAGHLWVFEDREGMTVRLAVKPGRVYPKPWGLGRSPAARPGTDGGKNFSNPTRAYKDFNHVLDFKIHVTTDSLPDPVLETDEDEEKAKDVVAVKPQIPIEETVEPAINKPETAQNRECEKKAFVPSEQTVQLLQETGIAAPVARVLAQRHPEKNIQAAVAYARGCRGELLNKPGYVVSALQNGWKLPGWCYKPERVENDAQKPLSPSQTPPLSVGGWLDPASDIPPDWDDRRRESPYDELWGRVCEAIKGKIQPESFATWIEPCFIEEISEGTVTLAAPNRAIAEWVEEHYLWLIQTIIGEMNGIREVKNARVVAHLIPR